MSKGVREGTGQVEGAAGRAFWLSSITFSLLSPTCSTSLKACQQQLREFTFNGDHERELGCAYQLRATRLHVFNWASLGFDP